MAIDLMMHSNSHTHTHIYIYINTHTVWNKSHLTLKKKKKFLFIYNLFYLGNIIFLRKFKVISKSQNKHNLKKKFFNFFFLNLKEWIFKLVTFLPLYTHIPNVSTAGLYFVKSEVLSLKPALLKKHWVLFATNVNEVVMVMIHSQLHWHDNLIDSCNILHHFS